MYADKKMRQSVLVLKRYIYKKTVIKLKYISFMHSSLIWEVSIFRNNMCLFDKPRSLLKFNNCGVHSSFARSELYLST